MNQKITGFHLDPENHWVAELACGHGQHVRHEPPFFKREWVTTAEGRTEKLGQELDCKRCDELGRRVAEAVRAACRDRLKSDYEDAGLAGLCDEGRWEAALGALDTLKLDAVIEAALRTEA